MQEIVKLMEVGFEVATEFEGKKLLRKRKRPKAKVYEY